MIDVMILYEHKNREMESILLLKHELMRRGYKVRLKSVFELKQIRYFLEKPKVIVCPYLYSDVELHKYIYEVFGSADKIMNLQWEQVYAGKSTYKKRVPSGNAANAVHICWGKKQYELLKQNGCRNAVLTGPIHMDFLKPAFRGWYMSREKLFAQYGIDPGKKTLLFISSFTMFYKTDEELEGLRRFFDFDIFEFRDISVLSRNTILDWFERLLKENDGINIVYRPHPGELSDERLSRMCEKYPNMYCISDHSVKQWIADCDIILNWMSTAGVEAHFAGKPNLFLRPCELRSGIEYDMFRSSCKVYDYDAFVSYTSDSGLLEQYYLDHPIDQAISEYYINDEDYAYLRICDMIEEMLKTNKHYVPKADYDRVGLVKSAVRENVKKAVYDGRTGNSPIAKAVMRMRPGLDKRLYEYSETLSREYITLDEEKAVIKRIHRILKGKKI